MKYFAIIIALIIFSSFLFTEKDKDIILWQPDRPLTWDDFKGKPKRRFAAASTSYDILKNVSANNTASATLSIQAVFFCKDSWRNKYWTDNTVLEHEQKHFDIVELFSRKLRKLLQETPYLNYFDVKSKSDSLYTIIDKQMDVYQDKYDDETDGSMNGDRQREWSKKIINEINNFNSYKNTSFTVSYGKSKK